MIYLDYAATTPMSEAALNIYQKVAKDYFGNPNSLHDIGAIANQLLNQSRKEIASHLNASQENIYFTSGGSDSNFFAIRSLLKSRKDKKHIITTMIEHSSIKNIFNMLKAEGYRVTYLAVDKFGYVIFDQLKEAITDETALVSIQHGNSEIGTVQNLEEIGRYLKERNILFHSDCVQTFGKIDIDVKKFHLDSISISSHKIYGPKGVGACFLKTKDIWKPFIEGTTHEQGFRPGTVNVPGIAAFATAAEEIFKNKTAEQDRIKALRETFILELHQLPYNFVIEGPSNTDSLANIIGMRINGIEGQYTMLECNRYGLCVSTGSACLVGMQEPSGTMLAIGRTKEEAKEFFRLSLGKFTTGEDIQKVIDVFKKFLGEYYK